MPQAYKSGDIVAESGVYRFIHEPDHSPPESLAAAKGDLFPTCRHCRDPRFELQDAFDAAAVEQFQV